MGAPNWAERPASGPIVEVGPACSALPSPQRVLTRLMTPVADHHQTLAGAWPARGHVSVQPRGEVDAEPPLSSLPPLRLVLALSLAPQ